MQTLQSIELDILQTLLSLLSLVVSAGILYIGPKLKAFIGAAAANMITNVLSSIVESVVNDFNQRIVAQAKADGAFTPQLAKSVKQDAIEAVLDQGGALIKLGSLVLGDVEQLVSSQIEKAVVKYKTDSNTQQPAPQQQPDSQTA